MNKKTKVNGISQLDTPQMEQMRATVVEQELSARSWKAYYEKMYYSIESEKLEAPYKEYQERAKVRIAEEQERMKEFQAQLQAEIEKQNQGDTVGELKLEEVANGDGQEG